MTEYPGTGSVWRYSFSVPIPNINIYILCTVVCISIEILTYSVLSDHHSRREGQQNEAGIQSNLLAEKPED